MADKFRLDQAGVEAMLRRLGSAGDDFKESVTNLGEAMDRYEGCWGEDKAGKKFAGSYVENATEVKSNFDDVPGNLEDAGEGIRHASGEFKGLDEENAKRFDQQLADSMQQEEK